MNEKLLMEVVRMLSEREEYYNTKYKNAVNRGDYHNASEPRGESLAYSHAREMLMEALAGNADFLREYDYYWQKVKESK